MKSLRISFTLLVLLATTGCESTQKTLHYEFLEETYGGISTVCIEGYVFVKSCVHNGSVLTQLWENTQRGPRPMECKRFEGGGTYGNPAEL